MSCREKGMMTCELYGWQHLLAASHFMYVHGSVLASSTDAPIN